VTQTYRVRYSLTPPGRPRSAADVLSVDVQADLEHIPGLLPPAAYIMYVEDLTAGQNVHWTRWPKPYRPGFGG
jgi:hypothetical protein